jgi:tRNA threonylcarbamoyladenosine biosynthesis protein TsaB
MIVLGIDTALEACSVGLATGDPSAAILRSETIGRGHAERLFGMIQEVMAEAGLGFDAIDRFAVTIGPGSFTGIRVGIAAVRGFALVSGAPAVGFSTLAVHAESARAQAGDRPVLAALPAKGGELFAQLFGPGGEELSEPALGAPEAFAAIAQDAGAMLAGAGAPAIAEVACELTVVHDRSAPDIGALLALSVRGQGRVTPPRPLYIKPPDAVPAAPMIAHR